MRFYTRGTRHVQGLGLSMKMALTMALTVALSLSFSQATNAAETSPFKNALTPKIQLVQTSGDFHLPRYDEFVKLPQAAQVRFMNAFQAALLELDTEAKDGATEDTASRLLNFWLSNACADADSNDFCINLGVVRPVGDDCNMAQGVKRHNFDTKKDLSDLGDGFADQCKGSQKPCSPVFGLNEGGNLYCASGNRTANCAQLAKADSNTISFATLLQACAVNQNPTKADCKKLANFYDSQSKLVEDHCQNSPATKACGILKAQIASVESDLSDLNAVMKMDVKGMIEGVDQANHAGDKLSGAKTDCPPGTKPVTPPAPPAPPVLRTTVTTPELGGKSTTTAPPAPGLNPGDRPHPRTDGNPLPPAKPQSPAIVSVVACTPKPLPANMIGTFDDISKYFSTLIPDDPNKDAACAAIALPNQSIMKVTIKDSGDPVITLQTPAVNGKTPDPVALDDKDAAILQAASAVLKSKLNIPDSKLFAAYFPAQFLTDAGTVSIGAQDGKPGTPAGTRGWITSDGTRIRYIPKQLDGGGEVDLGITLKDGKEQIVPLSKKS